MKVCTCFLLFGIFACIDSATNQRSVNLALETVLEFNAKDKAGDFKFLDDVQNFITKVKTVIDKNSHGNDNFRRDSRARVYTFTDFIQELVKIVNTYEDTAFVDFFDILDEEVSKYNYRGCKFNELTENGEIKEFAASKLSLIKGKPATVIKSNINALSDMLKYEKYDKNTKNIVDSINSLYGQADKEKFNKVVSELQAYNNSKSKSVNDLGKIIQNGVRSVIYDHYTNLNTKTRQDFKHKMEFFWKQLKKSPPSRVDIPNVDSDNKMNVVKNPESVSKKDLIITSTKQANNTIETNKAYKNDKGKANMKPTEYKDAGIKRDDINNEKKRYKNTRRDTTGDAIEVQEKKTTLLTSQKKDRRKNHEQSIYIDSTSIESYSSAEFQEKRAQRTKPKENLTTDKTKIKQKFVNVMRRRPAQKIWIQDSTGRLPQAVLDNLTNKPRHDINKNMTDDTLDKHGHKYKIKYVKKQRRLNGEFLNESKLDKRHKKKYYKKQEWKQWSNPNQKTKLHIKYRNEKNPKAKEQLKLNHNRHFFRENLARSTEYVSNTNTQQHKKRMRPVRRELKQDFGSRTATRKVKKYLEIPFISGQTLKPRRSRRIAAAKKTAESSKRFRSHLNELRRIKVTEQNPSFYNFSMGRLAHEIPLKAYPQRRKSLSSKPKRPSERSARQTSSSSEGISLEVFETKDSKEIATYSQRKSNKDPDVIRKINSLERQLNEVKNKINAYTDDMKTKEFKHSFEPKGNIVKSDKFEVKIQGEKVLTEDVDGNGSKDYKTKPNKSKTKSDVHMIPTVPQNKTDQTMVSETADNKMKVCDKDSKNNENNVEIGKASEARFRSDVDMTRSDFKNRTDKINHEETNKTENRIQIQIEHKYNEGSKNKEKIANNYHNMQENKEQDKNIEANLINNDDETLKAGIIVATRTSMKATETTTEAITTVKPTDLVNTLATSKLPVPVSIPVATSSDSPGVLKQIEFSTTVDESNKMVSNTLKVENNVSKITSYVTETHIMKVKRRL